MSPTALITGASSGIGARAARDLVDAGFTVYGCARRTDRLAELEAHGVRTFTMDVTDDDSMVAGVEHVIAEAGSIEVLVNNAGYGSFGALEEVPLAEGRRQFDVNVFGLARVTQLVVPHMRAAGRGRIINISSIAGRIAEPLGSWYHATKFAVEGLSDCWRQELAPHGIEVVVIQPGTTRSEWNAIARESLLRVSGNGPYAAQAHRIATMLANADSGPMGVDVEVVSRAIVAAATVNRPKTRYTPGLAATGIVALRRFLPDRAYDKASELTYDGLIRFGGSTRD